MINNANIIRSIFLSLFLCLIHNLNGQTATPEYALEVSDAFFDIQYGITPQFEDITPIMNGETTCLYQIQYQNGEWCLISADMSFDPILAYGLSNIDEEDEPEGFADLVKWYAIQIAEAKLNAKIIGLKARFNADVKAGQNDAKAGIYDKWYRHHRDDDGAAYDAGWISARNENENIQIIEG